MRIPGVFWGYNFPTGWYGHHVDEYTHLVNAETIMRPGDAPRWDPHPYPKGMAAHVAIPMLGIRALTGDPRWRSVTPGQIIVSGRIVSVLYGTATIFILFLLARHIFKDVRIAVVAAWMLALGGLHVSQSHFYLSDVPALFWYLSGTYLLLLEVEPNKEEKSQYLVGAAFCFGVAFGLKLVVAGLPTLAVVALMSRPRVARVVHTGVFFLAGMVLVNVASYTPYDFYETVTRGTSDQFIWSVWSNALLYMMEIASVVSFPIVLLAAAGSCLIIRELFHSRTHAGFAPIVLVIIVPLVISTYLLLFKTDNFPRHLIPFMPWIFLVAAWALIVICDKCSAKGISPALVVVPVFLYLAVFVFDGEKVFLKEPRNEAARWLLRNVPVGTEFWWQTHEGLPGYRHVHFPDKGRPPVVVIEMHRANHYLSGMGWMNSYPKDYRYVFAGRSQARVEALQALFRGTSEYKEVVRFSENYVMPEYTVIDQLIGNRSRNYTATIVIFMKAAEREEGKKS